MKNKEDDGEVGMEEQVIRIEDILEVLYKRWKMILSITIAVTIISALMSFFIISPKYQASTKVFIGKENNKSSDSGQAYDNNDVQMYQRLLKTYAEVIQTNDLVERALTSIGAEDEPESILQNLTVTPRTDTQILEIQYISKDNVFAKNLVESVTGEFIKTSGDLIPNGNVKIIEKVRVPEEPISPNKKLNIAIAFLLGVMFSVGLSFMLEFMDNTFKTKEQLEDTLGIPVLGAIPDSINGHSHGNYYSYYSDESEKEIGA